MSERNNVTKLSPLSVAEHGQAEKGPHRAQSGVSLTGKGEAEHGGMGHRVTIRTAKPPIALKVAQM